MADYSEILIDRENKRLYDSVVKMSTSPQFAYLGLNLSHVKSSKKRLEAGHSVQVSDSISWMPKKSKFETLVRSTL